MSDINKLLSEVPVPRVSPENNLPMPAITRLPPGKHFYNKKVLRNLELLEGEHPLLSVITEPKGTTDAMVITDRYHTTGILQMPTVRNLHFMGSEHLWWQKVVEEPQNHPNIYDGLKMKCNAPRVSNLQFSRIKGAAIRYQRVGYEREWPVYPFDREAAIFDNILMHGCYEGLIMQGSFDDKIGYVETAGIRGDGLRIEGTACQISKTHLYGCGRYGLALMGVGDDPLKGGGHYGAQIQTENNFIGLYNNVPNSTILQLITFGCWGWNVIAKQTLHVQWANISTRGPSATDPINSPGNGIDLRGAHLSTFRGQMGIAEGSIGINLSNTNSTQIDFSTWGGGETGRVMVVEGESHHNRVKLKLGACKLGVEIKSIGYGNHFEIEYHGSCPEPIRKSEDFDAKGNTVVLKGS